MKRDEYITELSERLRHRHSVDREARFGDAFLRWIEDPLKPRTSNGKIRLNWIVRLLAALAILAAATFLFFSVVHL
jgi:hypothetical protein